MVGIDREREGALKSHLNKRGIKNLSNFPGFGSDKPVLPESDEKFTKLNIELRYPYLEQRTLTVGGGFLYWI